MEPIRSHDALFRFVFGEPEQMAELLQGCLPPSLVGAIRWQTLSRLEALAAIERWRSLVARVLRHPRGRDVLGALCSWYLGRDPEDPTTLRTVMNKIEDEDLPMRSMLDLVLEMGEERGREKAELRGMRELLRSLLQARFGPLPEPGVELLETADAATLQRWSLRVLTAHELAEVFADGSS